MKIESYTHQLVELLAYDPRFPRVAATLIELVQGAAPELRVEHMGSTAVPECAGKGVVDLMVLYRPGGLAHARDVLAHLGFQHQGGTDPFPESRPMRVGAVTVEGTTYRAHLHVLEEDSAESLELLAFRDRLRSDAALRRAYEDEKRAVLGRGITRGQEYAECKTGFIRGALRLP
ncbi:MAG: GrpB family protein [bacterium]